MDSAVSLFAGAIAFERGRVCFGGNDCVFVFFFVDWSIVFCLVGLIVFPNGFLCFYLEPLLFSMESCVFVVGIIVFFCFVLMC